MLAHISGAQGGDEEASPARRRGHTTILAPMTVRRYRLLLTAVHPQHPLPGLPQPSQPAAGKATVDPDAVSSSGLSVEPVDAASCSGIPNGEAFRHQWFARGGPVYYEPWYRPDVLALLNSLLEYIDARSLPLHPAASPAEDTNSLGGGG